MRTMTKPEQRRHLAEKYNAALAEVETAETRLRKSIKIVEEVSEEWESLRAEYAKHIADLRAKMLPADRLSLVDRSNAVLERLEGIGKRHHSAKSESGTARQQLDEAKKRVEQAANLLERAFPKPDELAA